MKKNSTLLNYFSITVFILMAFPFSQKCYSQDEHKIDSLKTLLQSSKEDTNKVKLLVDLSSIYYSINPIEGIKYGKQGLALAEKLNWKNGTANANSRMALNYWIKSDYPKALEYGLKALKMFGESGDKNGKAKVLIVLGNIYLDQSDYPKALDYGLKALKLNEDLGDKNGIAVSLGNIGSIYRDQSDYPRALEYFLKAIKIFEELGRKLGIARNLGNIGNVYIAQKEYLKALEFNFKSLKLYEELGDKIGIAATLCNIGIVYDDQKDYLKSLEYYLKALEMEKELGDKNGIAVNLGNIGFTYLCIATASGNSIASRQLNKLFSGNKTNALQHAKLYCDSAIVIEKEIGDLNGLLQDYEKLSDIQTLIGDTKGALESYKVYASIKDSVFNMEKDKKLTQTAMQYEFDKKEAATKAETDKKSVLASAEIQRQKLIKNATLGGVGIVGIFSFLLVYSFNHRKKITFEKQISVTEMKALRSQMNPHFIFNSLNSIHSFIQQNKGEQASEYLIKFSRLMRLILENSNFEEVPLQSDLEALGLYMELEAARMNNKFSFSIDVDENIDAENTLIPPLILQPFVENSIWHGMLHKESGGHITINISKNGEMIKCLVEDNGIGREKATEMKSSLQKEKHKSLGMKITNERIDIINRVKKSKAFVALKDLYDEAKLPIGTLVEVQLPLELGF
ncbi:MAG: tetratricopeptide repeat protein [Bacteroidia bacterium]